MASDLDTISSLYYTDLVGRDEEPPDVFVDVLGTCLSRGRYRYTLNTPNIFLRFMIRGAGWGDFRGQSLPIAGDDFVLFWPGEPIDFHDRPDAPWEFVWMELGGKNASWAVQRAGFKPETKVYHLGAGNPVVPSAIGIMETIRRGGFHPVYPVAAAWDILWRTASHLGIVPDQGRSPDVATACRDHIRHQEGAIRISELAQHFKVSRSTLFRVFTAKYGMSPKDYIEQVRFERACHLLAASDLPVKEVARRCHYDNPSYFSQRFRRKFGCSPAAWMREHRRVTTT